MTRRTPRRSATRFSSRSPGRISKLKTWELVSGDKAGEGSGILDKVKSLVGLSDKG